MNIAILASSFLPRIGGAEMVVHDLAVHLRRQGRRVCVITWWGQALRVRGRVPYPVWPLLPRTYTLRSQRAWEAGQGRTAGIACQLAFYQRLFRFDVCNIHMAYPLGMLAAPALDRLGVPVVMTCHGNDIIIHEPLGFTLRLNPHLDRAITAAVTGSARVTAISSLMRAEYLRMGIPETRIDDVPNGVDIERISGMAVDRELVRRNLGIAPGQWLLLSVGRNHPQKGYQYIPEIARELARARHDFVWLVVGRDNESVGDAAARAGVGGRVRIISELGVESGEVAFAHPPAGLVRLYRAADVLMMPSVWESFGMVVVEAMAAGLPVVAARNAGCLDIIRPEETGLMCEPGDARGMAAAAQRLLDDPTQRAGMGAAARAAARRFDWRLIAEAYVRVYAKCRRQE